MSLVQFNSFNSTVPNNQYNWGTTTYTLGFAFTPVVNVTLLGVRFYRWTVEAVTFTALAYRVSNTSLLAAKDFTFTGTGWQTQLFDTPLALSAGVEYIAAYWKPANATGSDSTNWVDTYDLFTRPVRVYGGTSGTLGWSQAGRYSSGGLGAYSYPSYAYSTWYGVDAVFEWDDAYAPSVKRSDLYSSTRRVSGVMNDGLRPMTINVRKETVEGNPNPPCLALDFPGVHRFQWGVRAGTRTLKMDMKQVSNVAAANRPCFTIKANPSIGVNADVTGVAGAGTGWVTVGPVSVTPSSDGVLTVELWNRDAGTMRSPAYFDQMVKT